MKRKYSTESSTSTTSTVSTVLSSTATTISTMSSQVYHLLFSSVEGVINNIDNDVLKKIMSYLPLKDLNLQRLVSIRFRDSAEFIFNFCHLLHLPKAFSFNSNNQLASQKVIEFHSECEKITQEYPTRFVMTMGAENIAILPKKNDKEIENTMGRNKIMVHLYAKKTLAEKTEIVSEKINFYTVINSQQKDKLCVFENNGNIFPRGIYTEKYETLGKLVNNTGSELQATEDDKPLMQLCDEKGEVLDFSLRGEGFKF